MSWIKLRTKNGVLKIKPRWQMRYEERTRRVPVFDLGLILITWWPSSPAEPKPAASPAKLAQPKTGALNLLERELGAKDGKTSGNTAP